LAYQGKQGILSVARMLLEQMDGVIAMTSKRTLGLLGLTGLILVLAAIPAAADFQSANNLYKSGKYMEAAAEFQALVDEHPDYADGYHMLGICFLKSSKYDDAVKNFLKAVELNGDNFNFHFNLANAYRSQGKNDKVIKTLNNAEGLAPESAKVMVYQLRGYSLVAQGKWAEAIDDLKKAAAAKPDPATLAQLGKAYFKVGDYPAAVSALRKALQLQSSPGTWELLVEAQINVAAKTAGESAKKAKYGEALAEAEKFVAANPGSTDAKYLVGRTALGAGQFDKAVGAFKDVINREPGHCNAMANMGKAYTAKGSWSDALGALESATGCDAKMGTAWENMGFVLQKRASGSKDYAVQQTNYERAIAAYKKAQALKSSAAISKAIDDCQHNLTISRENQGMAVAESEQERKIAEEEARFAEEQAKQKAWEKKGEDD
jgi:tetratricopeptide (TPR) repeat protein